MPAWRAFAATRGFIPELREELEIHETGADLLTSANQKEGVGFDLEGGIWQNGVIRARPSAHGDEGA